MALSTSEIDSAVPRGINQRTLADGTPIDIFPIAQEVSISATKVAESVERLRVRGLVISGVGHTASIASEGHASLA